MPLQDLKLFQQMHLQNFQKQQKLLLRGIPFINATAGGESSLETII